LKRLLVVLDPDPGKELRLRLIHAPGVGVWGAGVWGSDTFTPMV